MRNLVRNRLPFSSGNFPNVNPKTLPGTPKPSNLPGTQTSPKPEMGCCCERTFQVALQPSNKDLQIRLERSKISRTPQSPARAIPPQNLHEQRLLTAGGEKEFIVIYRV